VNTPADLAPHPRPVLADGELGLAAFLDLFVSEEGAPTSGHPPFRESVARLVGWAQDSSRRAARWGAISRTAGSE
jgi:hypothetical protein